MTEAERARCAARRVPGVEARAGKFPGPSLIPALNAIQARLGWLPREELEELARDTRRPRYEIEGLVSFYPHFRTSPPPAVALHVCHDLPCYLRGGEERIAELRELREGDGDDPGDVELVEVSCLGRCDVAPAVAVNERPVRAGRRRRRSSPRPAPTASATPPRATRDEPWPNDPYPPAPASASATRRLRALLAGRASTPDAIVAALKDSGLRGMGGAGFPTGQKWDLVRGAPPAPTKYVICNADESEPGTFKDRQILATQPHLVLEGLLLAHGRRRRRAGLGLHPPRVRARGARAARGDRRAARGRARRARTCRSTCSSPPAATSSARRPRCWSAWRATAASRATSPRSPATTACTAAPR